MKNILAENLLRFGVKNLKENNMIRLKSLLKEQVQLTTEQEAWLDTCCNESNSTWTVDNRGYVTVQGNFECWQMKLQDFKGVKFAKVTGNFDCKDNQLTSLEGAPQTVDGDFICSKNKLINLKGGPKVVGKKYTCGDNPLSSLEGAPQSVGDRFAYPIALGTPEEIEQELNKYNVNVSGRIVGY